MVVVGLVFYCFIVLLFCRLVLLFCCFVLLFCCFVVLLNNLDEQEEQGGLDGPGPRAQLPHLEDFMVDAEVCGVVVNNRTACLLAEDSGCVGVGGVRRG